MRALGVCRGCFELACWKVCQCILVVLMFEMDGLVVVAVFDMVLEMVIVLVVGVFIHKNAWNRVSHGVGCVNRRGCVGCVFVGKFVEKTH